MTAEQEERLVASWEAIAQGLGSLNETARSAIAKQWPEAKPVREAVISRIPTPEDKIKTQTGNTDGSVSEWLSEFDEEEELGPREKQFLASQVASKLIASPKAAPKAKRPKV